MKRSWEQDEGCDGLDLPEEEFDYEEFVAREFGSRPNQQIGLSWKWWATAVFLVIALLAVMILGR